jgi:hypothetical protein
MIKATFYDPENGKILGAAVCGSQEELEGVTPSGASTITGLFDEDVFYILNGEAVQKPAKPSELHLFDYETKQWFYGVTDQVQWNLVRDRRNALLQQSDWTQLADVVLPNKTAWEAYRQALRDVTSQPDPYNIVWPTPP